MVLLGLSNTHLFWQGRDPDPVEHHHRPALLAFPSDPHEPIHKAHARLRELVDRAAGEPTEDNPLAKVLEVREPVRYKSFWNHGQARDMVPVAVKRSYWVPDVSDALFFHHGFHTCEHDIPYVERAHADLAAEKDWWMWDTRGLPARLKVLTYDIETTQYATGRRDVPIDMIGYADFTVEYQAQKDLGTEQFDFRFRDLPNDWAAADVVQLVARTEDEELQNLLQFTNHAVRHDVIAGHNILGFDNKQIHDRIVDILRRDERRQTLAPPERDWLTRFTSVYSKPDSSFHFGTRQEIVTWHPTSLDTFHAARKFYFFHDDFTLKGLAPWLGIDVPDRVYLEAHEMDLGPKTLLYNKHDVQEQVGITQVLLAQALPLAFVVNLPLEDLLVGGNTRMWDHMAFVRARRQRKVMPATSRAAGVARAIQRLLPGKPFPTREEVAAAVRQMAPEERTSAANKEIVRVAKQGPEMPFWCEHPGVIVRSNATDDPEGDLAAGAEAGGDGYGYAIPGGMTLKPDSELKSHFTPWFHVVAADVGAMYPTILKAQNLTADTVCPAKAGETPDDWIWLFELDAQFAHSGKYVVRKADPADPFTKGKGWLIGVKRNPEPGMVNLAMTGVMDTIQKVKRARSEAKRNNRPKDEVRILDMTYASLKAARNAGTHGILVAVNVSCRQFNVWGGANITTIGQRILHDALVDWEAQGIRVVYGDSLAGDRNVVVRDPRGHVRVMPLDELWEEVGGEEAPWHGKESRLAPGWQALAMDAETGGQGWRDLVRVVRHAHGGPLWRIGQRDGETVCTADHSLMVRGEDGVTRARPAEALDKPMVRVRVPRNEAIQEVDLLDWVTPLGARLSAGHGLDNRFGHARRVDRFQHDDAWVWYSPTDARIRFRRKVRTGSPEAMALMRLLGAYVAEGSVHWSRLRKGASIAESDPAWLGRLEDDYRLLFEGGSTSVIRSAHGTRQVVAKDGTVSLYEDTTHKLQMYNQAAALFFWSLAGKGSAGKRVPDLVFNLPRSHQEEFLRLAVEGDGSRAFGPRYTQEHAERHFRYETRSPRLAAGLSALLSQLGIDHGLRYRPSKRTYRLTTRDRPRPELRSTLVQEPSQGHVYDLEVADAHTFVDAMGCVLVHNTDGIYMGCSKSAGNLPHFAEALGADVEPEEGKWITMPQRALEVVAQSNRKFRSQLDYEGFELEAETHDCMVFVVHKNYLIFDARRDGSGVVMETKGNNFRGADKPPLAQVLLKDIMARALRDVASWSDEEKARESMKAAIKRATKDVMMGSKVKELAAAAQATGAIPDELVLRQGVSSVKSYEPNPDGTLRAQAVRTAALEQVIGDVITATRKFRFVVCKDPLPLYKDPRAQEEARVRLLRAGHRLVVKEPGRKGLKPIEYMWPAEKVTPAMVDWVWYRQMVEDYVKGAFGFDSLEAATQRGLAQWM